MKAIKSIQCMLLLGGMMFAAAACDEEEPINHAPVIVTGQATDVYRKGAFLSGSIQNPNGAAVKEYGIMISEFESMAEPTEYKMTNSHNVASFTLEAFSLTPKKEYFYCAYASSGASTVRGQVKSFTTPESNAPVFGEVELSNLGAQSVTVSSLIQDNGGSDISIHGFCWKTTDETANDPTVRDNVVNVEIGPEMITATVSGLMPEKEYLIRPYGVNSTGLGYGRTVKFSTQSASAPIMSWIASTDSTETSLSLLAAIGEKGRSPLTRFGFCWSVESQYPTVGEAHCELTELLVDSLLQYTIEEMSPLTTYYIRAYAENEHGVGYSDVLTFTTKKTISMMSKEPADITSHSALLQTEVDCDSATVPQQVGYCVSLERNEDMTLDNTEFLVYGTWNGKLIESKVDGLEYETQYFVRAFWINQSGKVSYGEMQTFTTGPQGIYNLEDLLAFRDERNAGRSVMSWMNSEGHFTLYNDIDLSSIANWQPVYLLYENEVFNGNGHTIKGVKRYCEVTKGEYVGFINYNRGTIKNLTIEAEVGWTMGTLENNSDFYYIAGICGSNIGEIDNCVFEGRITGKNATYDLQTYVAGICGHNNGNITQCKNYGSITNGINISGISGYNNRGTISDCDNYGSISCNENWGEVSGIVAYNYGENAMVSDCCNYGNLVGGAYYEAGHPRIVSGIVEHNFSVVKDCINEGSITGNYTVGIVESNYGTIDNCTNKGILSCDGGNFSGSYGICSHNYNIVRNCVNESNIVGKNEAAGIAGYNYAALDNFYPIVDNCTNKGDISAETYAAGIVVRCEGNTTNFTVQNCTNMGNIVGNTIYTGGIIGFINIDVVGTYSNNTNNGRVNGEPGTEANAIGYDARNE